VADTVHTTLFDAGWPDAPHRVIRNSTVAAWEKSGRPPAGARPGEGDVLARDPAGHEILRYEPYTEGADFEGEIEALSLWAGQGAGLAHRQQPASQIVSEISAQAESILAGLHAVDNREPDRSI